MKWQCEIEGSFVLESENDEKIDLTKVSAAIKHLLESYDDIFHVEISCDATNG